MKLNRAKKGFTIVELVIVIGVIGILSAILIPTFINVTKNAEKSAMKSNCANAYSAYVAEAADGAVDEGTYAGVVLKHVKMEEVELSNGIDSFIFDGEWKKGSLTVGSGTLTYVASNAESQSFTADQLKEASTFNGMIVQYVAE